MFLYVLIVCFVGYISGQKQNCGDFDAADKCTQKLLILGDPEFTRYPQNYFEMDQHCRSIVVNEKCIRDYSTKCLDTFANTVTSFFLSGVTKTNQDYCSSPQRKEAFMSLHRCGNVRKSSLDQRMYDLIDRLEAIANLGRSNDKIPLMCCNFNKFKSTIVEVSLDEREPKCSEAVMVEVDKLIGGFTDGTLNMMCPQDLNDPSNDKCDRILAKASLQKPNYVRPRSMLAPLIKIFNSLKN